MSVKNPQVIEGARGPRDERTALATALPSTGNRDHIPDGMRVYQSAAAKYQLQLTSPDDVKTPDGRTIAGKPIKAIFSDGFLVLTTKKPADAAMIKFLEESEYNTANGGTDFWDFQTVLDGIVSARRQSAVSILGNPEDRAAIIAALVAEGIDFDIPKQPTRRETKQGIVITE